MWNDQAIKWHMKFITGKCKAIYIRTTIQMLHIGWCALRQLSLLQACGVSSSVPQAQKDRAQPQKDRGSNEEEDDQGGEMDPLGGMADTPA